jgi:hypothetical protein
MNKEHTGPIDPTVGPFWRRPNSQPPYGEIVKEIDAMVRLNDGAVPTQAELDQELDDVLDRLDSLTDEERAQLVRSADLTERGYDAYARGMAALDAEDFPTAVDQLTVAVMSGIDGAGPPLVWAQSQADDVDRVAAAELSSTADEGCRASSVVARSSATHDEIAIRSEAMVVAVSAIREGRERDRQRAEVRVSRGRPARVATFVMLCAAVVLMVVAILKEPSAVAWSWPF